MSKPDPIEVDEDLTRKIAHLARLELTEEETKLFTGQLKDILSYFEQLNEVQCDGVAPLIHPIEMQTVLRDDVVEDFPLSDQRESKILKSAPEVLYDGYKVPPIL